MPSGVMPCAVVAGFWGGPARVSVVGLSDSRTSSIMSRTGLCHRFCPAVRMYEDEYGRSWEGPFPFDAAEILRLGPKMTRPGLYQILYLREPG